MSIQPNIPPLYALRTALSTAHYWSKYPSITQSHRSVSVQLTMWKHMQSWMWVPVQQPLSWVKPALLFVSAIIQSNVASSKVPNVKICYIFTVIGRNSKILTNCAPNL